MAEEMKYEQAIERIEEIVSLLDSDQISLDESLSLFEEGTRLTKLCYDRLKDAKARIVEIEKEQ